MCPSPSSSASSFLANEKLIGPICYFVLFSSFLLFLVPIMFLYIASYFFFIKELIYFFTFIVSSLNLDNHKIISMPLGSFDLEYFLGYTIFNVGRTFLDASHCRYPWFLKLIPLCLFENKLLLLLDPYL